MFQKLKDFFRWLSEPPAPEQAEEAPYKAEPVEPEAEKPMLKIRHSALDEYFINIATLVASRSTCLRRKVGAVAVLDKRILATGYNGAPRGMEHCTDMDFCLRDQLKVPSGQRHELCRAVHAEQNVIIQAAIHGVSLRGATLYCTTHPCVICAKMLINCGIARIVVKEPYWDEQAAAMLGEAGIAAELFNEDTGVDL